MPEVLRKAAQDLPPLGVIVDDLADRVEHVPTLGIHVTRSFAIEPVGRSDRPVVLDPFPVTDVVFRTRLLAPKTLDVQALGIIREAFVYPHIRQVRGSETVP